MRISEEKALGPLSFAANSPSIGTDDPDRRQAKFQRDSIVVPISSRWVRY